MNRDDVDVVRAGWLLPLGKVLAVVLVVAAVGGVICCGGGVPDAPDDGSGDAGDGGTGDGTGDGGTGDGDTGGGDTGDGDTGDGGTGDGGGGVDQPSSRLQPAQLDYQGAFRLPDEFGWGARGMAYDPAGNGGAGALLVTGMDVRPAEFAPVSIPDPTQADNWEALPEATMLTALTDFDGTIVETEAPGTAHISGIEIVARQGDQSSDKLYGCLDNWYGVVEETHRTVWFSELDGSNPRGPFHVGPADDNTYHGNKSGDFLFSVPQWYADQYLGGRFLMTGKTRGAFYGSQGPALMAFGPWDSEAPSGDLDALLVLYYRIIEACASPNVTNKDQCDFPEFTFCDKWEGGAFLESGEARTILLLGTKGLGTNVYGEQPDPSFCLDDRGYHCDPFERQVIFYDVDELGAAARGERDAWTVVPYATWRPAEFYLGNARRADVRRGGWGDGRFGRQPTVHDREGAWAITTTRWCTSGRLPSDGWAGLKTRHVCESVPVTRRSL